jgi:hypothetical protein
MNAKENKAKATLSAAIRQRVESMDKNRIASATTAEPNESSTAPPVQLRRSRRQPPNKRSRYEPSALGQGPTDSSALNVDLPDSHKTQQLIVDTGASHVLSQRRRSSSPLELGLEDPPPKKRKAKVSVEVTYQPPPSWHSPLILLLFLCVLHLFIFEIMKGFSFYVNHESRTMKSTTLNIPLFNKCNSTLTTMR